MRQDKMTTVPILLPGLLSRKGQNNACARDLHFARDTFTIIRLSARHTFKPERWDWIYFGNKKNNIKHFVTRKTSKITRTD